mgnify:CR=1 FL=1
MPNWEKFEKECTEYLNKEFNDFCKFIHIGRSDSTVPDILVKTYSGKTFYIEVKQSPAQCGQFVLLPDIKTQRFVYSSRNINENNKFAEQIISFMDTDFNSYKEAGTAGKEICFEGSENIFSNWIKLIYTKKNVEFFITNKYNIIPVQDFNNFFNVSAKYRVKRSGSSAVPKNKREKVINFIYNLNYNIEEIINNNKNIYIKSSQNIDKIRFIVDDYEYMLSRRDDLYEIRQLSNTFNANVIFSIELMNDMQGLSKEQFIKNLR